jgi:hypothetical protein
MGQVHQEELFPTDFDGRVETPEGAAPRAMVAPPPAVGADTPQLRRFRLAHFKGLQ